MQPYTTKSLSIDRHLHLYTINWLLLRSFLDLQQKEEEEVTKDIDFFPWETKQNVKNNRTSCQSRKAQNTVKLQKKMTFM